MKWTFALVAALSLVSFVAGSPDLADAADKPNCLDQLQLDLPVSGESAYAKFYQCLGHSPAEARAWAALRIQLAKAGESYLSGEIAPATYRAFLIDRQRKAERMKASPSYAEALGSGDSDGDLVPDKQDGCPNTAPLAATDFLGCDLKCPLRPAADADPVCIAAFPPNSAEDPRGPILDATVPVNLACEDATPAASAPIAWGYRGISIRSGRPPPFATIDSTNGWYFRVRRTNPQADGCEVWYAVQFTFRNPINTSAPPFDIVSVLFSSTEDEDKADPDIARFPMMIHKNHMEGDLLISSVDLPLSPGRTRLRDNISRYRDVSFRVRVITGAQQASAWSAAVAKAKGTPIDERFPP